MHQSFEASVQPAPLRVMQGGSNDWCIPYIHQFVFPWEASSSNRSGDDTFDLSVVTCLAYFHRSSRDFTQGQGLHSVFLPQCLGNFTLTLRETKVQMTDALT